MISFIKDGQRDMKSGAQIIKTKLSELAGGLLLPPPPPPHSL